MPSVSDRPQLAARAVAPYSRAGAVGLALIWPSTAVAAPETDDEPAAVSAEPVPAKSSPIRPLTVPDHESYRVLLSVSYALAPFAAVGLGHALSRNGSGDTAAGVGVGLGFFIPAVVHMAHGKPGHGVISFIELAGLTGVGVVVGGGIGGIISQAGCDPEEDSEGCDFAAFPGLAYGAVIGGVLAYTGFAIYDVLANGDVLHARDSADAASLRLSFSPLPASRDVRADQQPAWGGVWLGATLQM